MKDRWRLLFWIVIGAMLPNGGSVSAQGQAGSIRGVVHDADFGAPLAEAKVEILETGRTATTTSEGTYVLSQVPPGVYTLELSKTGYVRQVRSNVVVTAGRLTDADASLTGEFTEMEEFVVQDLALGAGTEASLLALRIESPALLDSISSDLLSRAGASDAAGALRYVAGASVQEGKFAVIRGLPDRYVSSQLNGVRLPSADEDTRAVELDLFPSAIIESIPVKKTFTPDQQGDASGGAVDVRLKGIPEETLLQLQSQVSYDSQVTGKSDFLTYDGGGVGFWGTDEGDRRVQTENLGGNWEGAAGTVRDDAPIDFRWSAAAGGKHLLDDGAALGGFASFFYERDSSFSEDGVDDSYVVEEVGGPLVPERVQQSTDPRTQLFDVTKASELVQWGGLGSLGLETERHTLGVRYLFTLTTEDSANLAEDTRGKQFFFPGYDPDDLTTPGHGDDFNTTPYLRTETLAYSERQTGSLQFHGRHEAPFSGFRLGSCSFEAPELDWTYAKSFADLDQPDKRQLGAVWIAEREPLPGFTLPAQYRVLKPEANFNQGNFQRIFKEIEEDGDQLLLGIELPFEQWSGDRGYLKVGLFDDSVERDFDQDTFSNFSEIPEPSYEADFDELWSAAWPFQDHPITAADIDVDYHGEQDVTAFYGMVDLPLSSSFDLVGGARFETTEISIVNDPEDFATWLPPGQSNVGSLQPGEGDVDFEQDDVLPSVGFAFRPAEGWTLRGAYSETVARQVFKELTPVFQQEFLGGPLFVGNPELGMSSLKNYDLRLDYTPYEGSLASVSWFYKDIEDPIEYVQRVNTEFSATTPVNFPEGRLTGFEVELRQGLDRLWDRLEGLSFGGNATYIDSEVTLPPEEQALFSANTVQAPLTKRDATNAPEYLYNLYLTYDHYDSGTQLGLFYTVQGDTLIAGAGAAGGVFVPSIYEKEVGTLNFSASKQLGEHVEIEFKAKNLTNPDIETIYRSDYLPENDVTNTSFKRGTELSIGISITN